MAIQNINATTAAQNGSKEILSAKTVTQDDFLKLLIAQLQNQDPLKPMDNQEFAAQLATFNSLGQLIDINQKLGALQSTQGAANQFSAISLIGKEVMSAGNRISLQAGGAAPIGYVLGANASRVVVNIHNGAGELVRQFDAGSQKMGEQRVLWDGKDAAGRPAPAGLYGFEINALDAGGRRVGATGRIQGSVSGVDLAGSEPVLQVGGLEVPLSSVIAVRSPR